MNARAASQIRTLLYQAKLAYSNSTPRPLARLLRPSRSTQERGFSSLFHLGTPGSLSVRDATAPAMSPKFGSPTKALKVFQPSRPTAIKSLGLRRNKPKIVTISRICRFCGRARPSFQAFTTDVAIPILAAR
jgi:hypothetical protein